MYRGKSLLEATWQRAFDIHVVERGILHRKLSGWDTWLWLAASSGPLHGHIIFSLSVSLACPHILLYVRDFVKAVSFCHHIINYKRYNKVLLIQTTDKHTRAVLSSIRLTLLWLLKPRQVRYTSKCAVLSYLKTLWKVEENGFSNKVNQFN